MQGNFQDHIRKFLEKLRSLDGQTINEGGMNKGMRLAKDEKGAWVNRLTDQYLTGESMDIPPEQLGITKEDIIREAVKREISKALGA